jgi:hypothetical protein
MVRNPLLTLVQDARKIGAAQLRSAAQTQNAQARWLANGLQPADQLIRGYHDSRIKQIFNH